MINVGWNNLILKEDCVLVKCENPSFVSWRTPNGLYFVTICESCGMSTTSIVSGGIVHRKIIKKHEEKYHEYIASTADIDNSFRSPSYKRGAKDARNDLPSSEATPEYLQGYASESRFTKGRSLYA